MPRPTRNAARVSTHGIRSKLQQVCGIAYFPKSAHLRRPSRAPGPHHPAAVRAPLLEHPARPVQAVPAPPAGVVWRSRPRAQLGSLPWHYTLDHLGAQIVAETLGTELKAVGYREDRKRTLVDSSHGPRSSRFAVWVGVVQEEWKFTTTNDGTDHYSWRLRWTRGSRRGHNEHAELGAFLDYLGGRRRGLAP
jgi:hypothetical protein